MPINLVWGQERGEGTFKQLLHTEKLGINSWYTVIDRHPERSRRIQSCQFLSRWTLVIWLSSSIISVCVGSREGKRHDSEQVGKQVRQGSRVPMVRGRGWGVVVVNRTVLDP